MIGGDEYSERLNYLTVETLLNRVTLLALVSGGDFANPGAVALVRSRPGWDDLGAWLVEGAGPVDAGALSGVRWVGLGRLHGGAYAVGRA